MGIIFSRRNQQKVIRTMTQLDEEINLFRSNETVKSLSTTSIEQHHDQLVSSFLEIAVGQTDQTARNFLRTTNWNIDQAINLFLFDNNYDPESSGDSSNDSTTGPELDSSLSSLYRPPINLLFEGSFEDAKLTSSRENLWLLVNLQSRTEFASLTLNRDLWSNDAVSQTVESSFILWQVYDHTIEGQKISTFYRIDSAPPVVLLIDPVTGQKMFMWSGKIEVDSFVEDLVRFIEAGPQEHIASLTKNINLETKETCLSRNKTFQIPAPSWGEEFEKEDACSSRNNFNQVMFPSWGEEFGKEDIGTSSNNFNQVPAPSWGEEFENEDTFSLSNNFGQFEELTEVNEEEICSEFPELTKEPKEDCDRSFVCNLCFRFPDGRRKQRRFLKTEPIQLLWSFCYYNIEASEKKAFKLVQAIPGASKTLDYEANLTFDQSRLANSMISVIWE